MALAVKRMSEAKEARGGISKNKLTRTESQRRWEASSFQKLKDSMAWEIRGQDIPRGAGRVYIDGVRSTREMVFKALGLSDRIFCMLLSVGNFTFKGHKIELRKPEKEIPIVKPKRIPFTKEEVKARAKVCERARYERKRLEKGLVAKPPIKQKACVVIKFALDPYPIGFCHKSAVIHVNGEKTGRDKAAEITGLSMTWIRNRVGKGAILVNGFRIELMRNSKISNKLEAPTIRPCGKKYQLRLNYHGKKYVYHTGSFEDCEKKLKEILIGDKWKEKLDNI